jgi:hypothetical protein
MPADQGQRGDQSEEVVAARKAVEQRVQPIWVRCRAVEREFDDPVPFEPPMRVDRPPTPQLVIRPQNAPAFGSVFGSKPAASQASCCTQ